MNYILFFDSGMGGLSVMREAIKIHPEENYIYYADNKNLPYGEKDMDTIRELTLSAVSSVMAKYPVKAIVIACNTATSAAVRALRYIYKDIPIIGIEPAIKPACEQNRGGRIAVLATEATLRQPKFLSLTKTYEALAEIYPIPCPGLVDFVERDILNGDELYGFLKEIYLPYSHIQFNSIVLGCTHYPFLKDAISHVFNCENVIDGGMGTANNLFRQISRDEGGKLIFINSSKLTDFEKRAKKLLFS